MDKAHTKNFFIKGFESLKEVFLLLIYKNNQKNQINQCCDKETSYLSEKMFNQLLNEEEIEDFNEETANFEIKKKIDDEILNFANL